MINEHSFQAEGLSDKHKLLFAQRKAEFLQDFGEDVAALEAAEKEVRLLYIMMITAFQWLQILLISRSGGEDAEEDAGS